MVQPMQNYVSHSSGVKSAVGDGIAIIKIDVDKNPEVSWHYQVQEVPTLILFSGGQVRWSQSGIIPAKILLDIVNLHSR